MSDDARTFILKDESQWKLLVAFVKANAAAMAEQGKPLAARVYRYSPRASDKQRALIWICNDQIAEQAWVGGRKYDAETWHEHCKRELLPDETAKGVKKWRHLPDGSRVLAMGTEDLDRAEKSLYIDALIAWAATEVGVEIRIQVPKSAMFNEPQAA